MVDYASAGVDIEAGDRAVELMKKSVKASHNDTVVAGAGGFAGMIDASALLGMRQPLLASSTDGVGTKVALAQALDTHHTIGQDLVAMVVDDIVVMGARPLLMTDYIACGQVVPERIADIVRGIAQACAAVDCPLVGGETAEHPGLMEPDEYDLAGAATGVVEADQVRGAHRVKTTDAVIAMASSGIHANGFSLIRRIIADAGWSWEREVSELGAPLGQTLLTPTALYTRTCLDLIERFGDDIHAFSHITGGGLGANISRVLPAGLTATVARDSWVIPPVFTLMQQLGDVPWEDLEQTLNLGVGMVALVSDETADSVLNHLREGGTEAWILGEVTATELTRRNDGETSLAGRLISGTKGVAGGAAYLHGTYRT